MSRYENIPPEFKALRIWNYSCAGAKVLSVQSGGLVDAPPKAPLRNARIHPEHGLCCSFASADSSFGWLTFDAAQEQMQLLRDRGLDPVIGIQMKGVPVLADKQQQCVQYLLCVDVDVKPEVDPTGAVTDEAREAALEEANRIWEEKVATVSYAERSPGGFGWRIFFIHPEPFKGNNWEHGECYTGSVDSRFMRLTGLSAAELHFDTALWDRVNGSCAERSSEDAEALTLGDIPDAEEIAPKVAGLDLTAPEQTDVDGITAGMWVIGKESKPDPSQSMIAIFKIAIRRGWPVEDALAWARTFDKLMAYYRAKAPSRDEVKRKTKYWWAKAQKDVAAESEATAEGRAHVEALRAGAAERVSEAVASGVTPSAGVVEKEAPRVPKMPRTGIFGIVGNYVRSTLIGEAAEYWVDAHTLWLTQHVLSHFTYADGTRLCPQAILFAPSGSGKSALDDLLDVFESNPSYGQNKRSGSSIGSGAGIRAALKAGIYTTVSNEECGADMKRIFAPDAKGHDRDARETLLQAVNKKTVKPHLVGTSNKDFSTESISGFMFASHLATQPHNAPAIMNDDWAASGAAIRFPPFMIVPPTGHCAAFRYQPIPDELVSVLTDAGNAFTAKQMVNIATLSYTVENKDGWKSKVQDSCKELLGLPGGEMMINRVAELAVRYAVVHHMAHTKHSATPSLTGTPPPAKDVLTQADFDFGQQMARYHTDVLVSIMNDSDAPTQDSAIRYVKILRALGPKITEQAKSHGERRAAGLVAAEAAVTVTAYDLAKSLGGLQAGRGRPKKGMPKVPKVTTEEMGHILRALCSKNVLRAQGSSFLLEPRWGECFDRHLQEEEARLGAF